MPESATPERKPSKLDIMFDILGCSFCFQNIDRQNVSNKIERVQTMA